MTDADIKHLLWLGVASDGKNGNPADDIAKIDPKARVAIARW